MDMVVKFLLEYIPDAHIFPVFLLLSGWLIWLILKRTTLPRPTLPIMLIYSVSVAIEFIKSFRRLEVCIELCLPDFSLLPFIMNVGFWFIVLYLLMKWMQGMNWHDVKTNISLHQGV